MDMKQPQASEHALTPPSKLQLTVFGDWSRKGWRTLDLIQLELTRTWCNAPFGNDETGRSVKNNQVSIEDEPLQNLRWLATMSVKQLKRTLRSCVRVISEYPTGLEFCLISR